jgi:hypothetical protein
MTDQMKVGALVFGTFIIMITSLLLADANQTKQRIACVVEVPKTHNVSETKDLCN